MRCQLLRAPSGCKPAAARIDARRAGGTARMSSAVKTWQVLVCCLSVCRVSVCLSVFLSVGLSVCLLVCRSVRSVGLSVAAFVNTELRLCAQIGRRCPRWSCASRIRTTTCPRWTSYFSLFREYHSQSHPRLLIKISQVLRFFKYCSDLVPNNTFV